MTDEYSSSLNYAIIGESNSTLEQELWDQYEARRGRRFKIACSLLLAVIFGFDAWLVWLIWFNR